MVTHTYLQSLSKDISKYTDPGYLVNLRCYRAFKWDGGVWMWAIICMQVAPCQNFANCLFVAPWLIFLPAATFFLSFSTSFSSKLPRNSQMCEKWKVGEKWSLLTTVFEKGGRKRKSGFAALGKLEQISLGTVCAKSLNCWQSSWKYSNWLSELYIRSQRSKEPKNQNILNMSSKFTKIWTTILLPWLLHFLSERYFNISCFIF